jgi:hypothetical protein
VSAPSGGSGVILEESQLDRLKKNGLGLRRTGTTSFASGQEAQRQGTGWSDDLVPFASNSAAGGVGGRWNSTAVFHEPG